MDLHATVVNTMLSFDKPFTYKEPIYALNKKVKSKKNREKMVSIIKELFDATLVRVVPFCYSYTLQCKNILTIEKKFSTIW